MSREVKKVLLTGEVKNLTGHCHLKVTLRLRVVGNEGKDDLYIKLIIRGNTRKKNCYFGPLSR